MGKSLKRKREFDDPPLWFILALAGVYVLLLVLLWPIN